MSNTQHSKLGKDTHSLVNFFYGNNNSVPVVGEYATQMHYTDRTVYLIHSISADGKTVVLEYCDTKANPLAIEIVTGHQSWVHKPTGQYITLKYRSGKWRKETSCIEFTSDYIAKADAQQVFNMGAYLRKHEPRMYDVIYKDNASWPVTVITGVTKLVKSYTPFSVIFGVCDYHYDWSF